MAHRKPGSANDLYGAIHELLLGGVFKPGERITETALAERFGVSRTPVRDVLRRLESQGLLEHQPHRGMVVPTLDSHALSELYAMREVLEGTAAALAARHASPAEIAVMKDLIARDRAQADDPDRLARSNKLFHRTIQRAAHNRYLMQSLNGLEESLALLGPTSLSVTGRSAEALDQHERIVDAIAGHDSEAAGAAARAHIEGSHQARLTLLLEKELAAAAPAI